MENQDFYNLSLGIAGGFAAKVLSGPLIRKPVNALIIKCVDKLAEDSSAFLKPAMDGI